MYPSSSIPLTQSEQVLLKYLMHQILKNHIPWHLTPLLSLFQDSISQSSNSGLQPICTVFATVLQSQFLSERIDWELVVNYNSSINLERLSENIQTWRKKSQGNWDNSKQEVTDLELYQFYLDRLSGKVDHQGIWQIPYNFPLYLHYPNRPYKGVEIAKLIKAWQKLRTDLVDGCREVEKTRVQFNKITEELQNRKCWDSQRQCPLPYQKSSLNCHSGNLDVATKC